MARAKNETKKEDVKNVNKLEELTAKKEAEIIEKQESEKKAEMSELEKRKLERKKQREALKKINEDTVIFMYCNIGGAELIYVDEVSGIPRNMVYGDSDWFTFKELKNMKSRHKRILEDYALIPIDVDSNDFELEDVLKLLGIDNLYKDEAKLFEDNLDYILNNLKFDTFSLILKEENKKYVKRIIDRAKDLFLKGEFNDYQKIQYIEDLCDDKEHVMFNSLLESDKYDKEH